MKKLKKDMRNFVGSSVLLGAGAAATGGLAGVSGVPTGAGLVTMGSMMSPIAATMGATHALRLTKRLKPKRRRRK